MARRVLMRWLVVLTVVVVGAFAWHLHGASHARWDARTIARMTADLQDAEGTSAPPTTLSSARKVLIYFSASWCPPCRAFTPELVSFYKTHRGGSAFQILFVSQDTDPAAMQAYMHDDGMPWWGVRFGSQTASDLRSYCGRGIPCLVLVDAHGRVLADSFDGSTYLGPHQVLDVLGASL